MTTIAVRSFAAASMLALLASFGCSNGCSKKDASTSQAQGGSAPKAGFKDKEEEISYIIGFSTGKGFREQGLSVNQDSFQKGLKDGLDSDEKAKMTEQEMQKSLDEFRVTFMEKRRKELFEMGEKNKKEGEQFLTDNKKKEGIQTTASGLQYKIIKATKSGQKAKAEDTVNVEYTGTLLNGKVFDSSQKQGGTTKFQVSRTIKGMSEALGMMDVGDEWEIYVPSTLAYGEQNIGSTIGPNSTLIFKVKLVSIEQPKKEEKAETKPSSKS